MKAQTLTDSRCISWKFPFKPVRVPENTMLSLDPSLYTMERKLDGWRAMVVMSKKPTLWTREKVKIEVPTNLEEQLLSLNLPEGTVLDSEIWNPLKRGSWRHNTQVQCKLSVWDVIKSGTKEMGSSSIEDRRKELNKLIGNGTNDIKSIEVLGATVENFNQVLNEAKQFRMDNTIRSGFIHGVVIKRNGSPRRDHPTRSTEHPDWLKIVFPGM